jgi:hypothetical protein
VKIVLKSGSLNLLEQSVLVLACTWVTLPLYRILKNTPFGVLSGIKFISSFGENRSTGDKHTYTQDYEERERNRKDKTINVRRKTRLHKQKVAK